MKPLSSLMFGSLQKFKPIEVMDIAKAMIVAAHEQQTGKHIYEYNEIVSLARRNKYAGNGTVQKAV